MEGLDAGPQLVAAGRAAADRFADVELKPAELADTRHRLGGGRVGRLPPGRALPAHARLRLRAPDALLVALTLTPALALLGA